ATGVPGDAPSERSAFTAIEETLARGEGGIARIGGSRAGLAQFLFFTRLPQSPLLPLAGEDCAQRRMRALLIFARLRRTPRPLRHLPPQAGEGKALISSNLSRFPSPACGRRWRVAPDEGALDLCAPAARHHPPSAPSPASGGRARLRFL